MTALPIVPSKPIAQFLDDLRAAGQSVVPDSLIWIPDPANPRRLIAAVMVQNTPSARPNMRA